MMGDQLCRELCYLERAIDEREAQYDATVPLETVVLYGAEDWPIEVPLALFRARMLALRGWIRVLNQDRHLRALGWVSTS